MRCINSPQKIKLLYTLAVIYTHLHLSLIVRHKFCNLIRYINLIKPDDVTRRKLIISIDCHVRFHTRTYHVARRGHAGISQECILSAQGQAVCVRCVASARRRARCRGAIEESFNPTVFVEDESLWRLRRSTWPHRECSRPEDRLVPRRHGADRVEGFPCRSHTLSQLHTLTHNGPHVATRGDGPPFFLSSTL